MTCKMQEKNLFNNYSLRPNAVCRGNCTRSYCREQIWLGKKLVWFKMRGWQISEAIADSLRAYRCHQVGRRIRCFSHFRGGFG